MFGKHRREMEETEAEAYLIRAACDADEQGLMDRANQGAGRTDKTLRDSLPVDEAVKMGRRVDRGNWRSN